MKILVTGGAGFIGSHIVDAYLQLGHEVFIVDDLSTGAPQLLNPAARFFPCDIRSDECARLIREEKFDLVNHHAAQIDVRIAVDEPDRDASINIVGSLRLAKACLEAGVSRLIFISSGGAVYGEISDAQLPAPETHPIQPVSPYGASKYCVERYLQLFHEQNQLDFVTLRYGNVYGERQGKKGEAGVVSLFARRLLQGKPVTIFGSGEQLRDYTHVADVVAANMAVSNPEWQVAARRTFIDSAYNIGTGQGYSVNHLYEIMESHLQTGLKAAYDSPRAGEINKTYLDCGKAHAEFGWRSRVPFADGIRRTVDWFKSHPEF